MTSRLDPKMFGHFREFCELEKAAGGPDPHMRLAGALVEDAPTAAKWWMGGCYIGVYNYPTAEKLFENWTLDGMRAAQMTHIVAWLEKHWKGIATRRERRAVRTPIQLARFLKGYADWASDQLEWGDTFWTIDHTENYETFWHSSQTVYSLGRYVSLKLGEFLRRYADVPIEMPDLRLRGGWSPMEGLSLLFPDQATELNGGDQFADLGEELGAALRVAMREYGTPLDLYETQVLLCDFKQCWSGKRQYPGRSQDSELEYYAQVSGHWGPATRMFEFRQRLFPAEVLGELQGWEGVRKELGHFLTSYGYNWSDLKYLYGQYRDQSMVVTR